MRSVITRTALGCLALGVALTLTGCDFPGTGSKSAAKSPAAAEPSDDNWDQAIDAELNLLSGLKGINPDLIADQQKAIDAAADLCKEIKKPSADSAGLGALAVSKFPDAQGLTPADGDKIVAVLKDTTCK